MTWTVEVDLSDVDGYRGPRSIELSESDPNQLFVDAFDGAFQKANDLPAGSSLHDYRDSSDELIVWIADNEPVHTGSGLTVGQLRSFLGEKPPVLRLAWGVGGDNEILLVETIWALVNFGLTIGGIKAAADQGWLSANRLVYRKQHEAFEDWADGEAMTGDLVTAAKAEADWTPADFNRKFGASNEKASEFFKDIGYEPTRDEWGNRHWVDPDVIKP